MYILANLLFTSKSFLILNFQAHMANSWTQPKVPYFINVLMEMQVETAL